MILAVGNTKGGVGKTTLAVNIAAARALRGRDVLLIDGDEQASAATFAQIRAATTAADFATVQLHGAAIRQQMRSLAERYDEIVIDVGGRNTESLRAALTVADVILIPFQPRSIDLWAAAQIGAIIAEARHVNPGLRAWAVLNVADPQGPDNIDAAAALQAQGIEALPWAVGRRKAFPNAFSGGLSVLEQERKDPKAVSEILFIVDALYAQELSDRIAPNVDTMCAQEAHNDYQNAPHRKVAAAAG